MLVFWVILKLCQVLFMAAMVFEFHTIQASQLAFYVFLKLTLWTLASPVFRHYNPSLPSTFRPFYKK